MVVPSRRNRMVHSIMRNQELEKDKGIKKLEEKEITSEEHEERIKKLRELGLIK